MIFVLYSIRKEIFTFYFVFITLISVQSILLIGTQRNNISIGGLELKSYQQ
jgi:hypothetical protein